MEIRLISDEEKEGLTAYLDLLMDINGSIDKLAEVIYDSKKYLVARGEEEGNGIVLNDGGKLEPFYISLDHQFIEVLCTKDYVYNIINSDIKEVVKTNPEHTKEVRVSYLPAIENFPRDRVEYSQYDSSINSLLEMNYDVTGRDAETAVAFTNYHYADTVRFTNLEKYGPFVIKRRHQYHLGINEETVYYSPLFVIRDYPVGCKNNSFDANDLMSQFEKYGFTRDIPTTLQSLVTDRNEVYKSLKLVNNEYKKFIKEQ